MPITYDYEVVDRTDSGEPIEAGIIKYDENEVKDVIIKAINGDKDAYSKLIDKMPKPSSPYGHLFIREKDGNMWQLTDDPEYMQDFDNDIMPLYELMANTISDNITDDSAINAAKLATDLLSPYDNSYAYPLYNIQKAAGIFKILLNNKSKVFVKALDDIIACSDYKYEEADDLCKIVLDLLDESKNELSEESKKTYIKYLKSKYGSVIIEELQSNELMYIIDNNMIKYLGDING